MVNFLITTVVLVAIWVEFYPSFVSARFVPPPLPPPLPSSTSSVSASTYVSSKATHCPCIFFVSTSLNSPNFDFLAIPSNRLSHFGQFTDSSLPFLADFSHLNLSKHNAFRRDKNQHVHQFRISDHHAFTIVLRFTNRQMHNAVYTSDHLRIVTIDFPRLNSSCPVKLPQQPPQNCDDCLKQKAGLVPLSSNTDRQEHTNLNPPSWIPPTLASTKDKGRSTNHDESPPTTSRVVGGHIANADLSNYVVSILTVGTNSTTLCSGTLVSPTIVLTAAHCEVSTRTTSVSVGRLNSPELVHRGTEISVKSFTRYPDFDRSQGIERSGRYDIAILRLKWEAPSTAKFMKVNINESVPIVSSYVRNAGYGSIALAGDSVTSNIEMNLYQVDSPVVSNEECRVAYGYPIYDLVAFDYLVCAGYLGRGGCGACQGDSGGPLFQYDADDEPVLVGIVSSGGITCFNQRFPPIHVRTSAFADFIPDDEGIRKTQSTVAVMEDEDRKEEPGKSPDPSKLPLATKEPEKPSKPEPSEPEPLQPEPPQLPIFPNDTIALPFPTLPPEEPRTPGEEAEDEDMPRPPKPSKPRPPKPSKPPRLPDIPVGEVEGSGSTQGSSLSTGAIVGIVCAVVFVLVLVFVGVFGLLVRGSGGPPAGNV